MDRGNHNNYNNLPKNQQQSFVRGWSWGEIKVTGEHIEFESCSTPWFVLPYSGISNVSQPSKNEIGLEFNLEEEDGDNQEDQLCEMRLYIPNKYQDGNIDEDMEEKKSKNSPKSDESEMERESDAKNTMAETIKDEIMKYANIGSLGDSIAHFPEISMLTPRGKFDVYMLKNALKIHGPSHDYKISYKNISRAFLLPKPDGVHLAFVVALNNPIRQGKTVYPFLVFQFKDKAAHKPVTLNIPEDEAERKALFKTDIIDSTMTGEVYDNMAKLFKALIGIAVVIPSKSFRSSRGATSIKCSVKANEGYLYFLEKCLMFIHKPVLYISLEDVKYVECSRVNDSNLQQRTFDFSVYTKKEELQFVGIEKNELEAITNYFNIKKIRIKSAEGGEIKASTTTSRRQRKAPEDVPMELPSEDEFDDDYNSEESMDLDDGGSDEDEDEESEKKSKKHKSDKKRK